MRTRSTVATISWIPSEAVTGGGKVPFSTGMAHYDDPPPDSIESIDQLRTMVRADRFRFANWLSAWIEVEGGRVVDYGMDGESIVCSTTLRLGVGSVTFASTTFAPLRVDPEVLPDGSVRFVQTCGGRTGIAAPRTVTRAPFFQLTAPTAWTTLELLIHPDGRAEGRLVGSSPFPRHWVYDSSGRLFQKSSLIDFSTWRSEYFGEHTPWGAADSPAVVQAVESALERQLSLAIMRKGDNPQIRHLVAGEELCSEGQPGIELYLLLDGVLEVWVDGSKLAEIGPGAVLGERALIENGRRTSTLRALTPCKVAVVPADKVDRLRLEELARGHHRERQ